MAVGGQAWSPRPWSLPSTLTVRAPLPIRKWSVGSRLSCSSRSHHAFPKVGMPYKEVSDTFSGTSGGQRRR